MVVASFLELLGFGMVILILNTFLGLNDSYPEIVNYFFNYFLKTDVNFELILIFIYYEKNQSFY